MAISDLDDLDESDEWDQGFIELKCLKCEKWNRFDVLDDLLFPQGYVCILCDPEKEMRLKSWMDLISDKNFTNK